MKNLLKTTWIFSLTLLFCSSLLISCTQDQAIENSDVALYAELGVETYDVDHIAGKMVMNDHKIVYDVKDEKGEYFITLNIDDYTLEAWVDFDTEGLVHKGYDAVLSESQKEVLLSFVQQFGKILLNNNGNSPSKFEIGRMEYTFLNTVEYWSQAPRNYVYTNRTITTNMDTKSLRNDGVQCLVAGKTYKLYFDDRNGNQSIEYEKTGYDGGGTFGCMGRCGADCGWGAPSAWTFDCFEHDECGLELGASGGATSPDCGDEFNEAADDWTWGVWRGCSCASCFN